ncbi:tyrosine-type recombinase/integrase [Ferrimonas futtsuensis]|uniref:tyrosine-type recombinase/integrase n=1 Tax=Ferrimonas futtsuensis TaxID=364764 RepID=UPI0004129C36
MRAKQASVQAKKHPHSAPYLFQSRHGIWYARVVVPKDSPLRSTKSEIRQSLRTRCYREAVQRSWLVLEQLTSHAKGEGTQQLQNTTQSNTVPSHKVPVEPLQQKAQRPQDDSPKLSEVIRLFTAEKRREGAWRPHEIAHNEFAYAELIKIVGDIRLSRFDGRVALKYKQHFLNAGKLAIPTINKRIGKVKNLLQWAAPYYGTQNPMQGITLKQKRRVRDQRKAVSDAMVRRLLIAARDQEKYQKTPFKRWLPFLGAYTGARIAELAQLYLDDLKVIDGYPCIHIQATQPYQSLKTPSSERVIPIHPQLIEEGFLKFAEARRAAGHARLFPEIPAGNRRGFGHKPSLWFTKFRAKLGWGEGETFHSLRHTVVTKLKRGGFSSELVAGLVGHSHGSITFDRYGKEYRVTDLVSLIRAIDYDLDKTEAE